MPVLSPSASIVPGALIEAYNEWELLDVTGREELNQWLRIPSSDLWTKVCKRAVDDGNATWLSRFADCDSEDYLPWPFNGWATIPVYTNKKFLILSIANCAMAAINSALLSGGEAARYAERAILFRRKSIGGGARTASTEAQSREEAMVEQATSDLSSESLEVKYLISYLGGSMRELPHDNSRSASARFPVVVSNIHGRICELEVRRVGRGRGRLFRDPFIMPLVPFDEQFLSAVHEAFTWVQSQYQIPATSDFCWCVFDRSDQVQSFGGRSIGFAAAVALRESVVRPLTRWGSWKRSLVDKLPARLRFHYAFTGGLDSQTGNLTQVGGYLEKLETLDPTYTLFIPEDDFPNLSGFIEDNRDIRPAKSLLEVLDQTKKLFPRLVKVALSAGAILLLMVVAGLYWASIETLNAAADKSARLAAERSAAADKSARLAAETDSAAEEKLAEAATLQANADKLIRQNAEAERDLARRKQALAVQQSEVLETKNEELALARKREELQRQRAEVNERKAAASQQVAVASRFAAEGFRRLAENDKAGAEAYFAKAIQFDDQDIYRSGFLQASFDAGVGTHRLLWEKDDLTSSCVTDCGITSVDSSGELLAATSNDNKSVQVIRTEDGAKLFSQTVDDCVARIAIGETSKGILLAAKACSGTTTVTNIASGLIEKKIDTQVDDAWFDSLSFSADGNQFAVISGTCSVRVYNTSDWALSRQLDCGDPPAPNKDGKISAIAFGPDGVFAYAIYEGPVFVTASASGSPRRIEDYGPHFKIGFTGAGDLIVADQSITILPKLNQSLGSGGKLNFKTLKKGGRPDILFASAFGQPYFIVGGDSGTVQLRTSDEVIRTIGFHTGKAARLFLGSNGRVVVQTLSGRIYCWELVAATYRKYNDSDEVDREEFGKKTRYVSVVDAKIFVKDSKTERTIFTLPLKDAVPESASLSPDNTRLIVNSDPIVMYDLESGRKIFEYDLKGPNLFVVGSNGNDKIAVVRGPTTQILSVSEHRIIGEIANSPSAELIDLQFSPQDTFLVAQMSNGLNFVDTKSGSFAHFIPLAPEHCPLADTELCSSWAISPDERYVGISHLSGRVEVWSLDRYRHLFEVVRNGGDDSPEQALGIGFSSDSRLVVWTSAGSGRLHFYDLNSHRTLPDLPTGMPLSAVTAERGKIVLMDTLENLFVTNEDEMVPLLIGSAEQIADRSVQSTTLTASTESPRFSQAELSATLGASRPKPAISAHPKMGGSTEEAADFSGLQPGVARRNPNGGAQCLPAIVVPIFNAYLPAFGKPDFCSELPPIDIAKDVPDPAWANNWDEWKRVREYHDGDRLLVGLYIANSAANNLDPNMMAAKNVVISTSVKSDTSKTRAEQNTAFHIISTRFTADNAAPLEASVVVKTEADEYLEVVPRSGFMFDWQGRPILDEQNLDLGNGDFHLGNLDEDWQYSLFLTYKIVVRKRSRSDGKH